MPTEPPPLPAPPRETLIVSEPARAARPSLSVATLAAAVMAGSFWLPWVNFLFIKASGAQIAADPGYVRLLWLIPVFGALTVLTGFLGSRQGHVAPFAGCLPWLALAYELAAGGKQIFDLLEIGAWLSLGAGAVLLLSPYLGARNEALPRPAAVPPRIPGQKIRGE